jgi:hypothetical protein
MKMITCAETMVTMIAHMHSATKSSPTDDIPTYICVLVCMRLPRKNINILQTFTQDAVQMSVRMVGKAMKTSKHKEKIGHKHKMQKRLN